MKCCLCVQYVAIDILILLSTVFSFAQTYFRNLPLRGSNTYAADNELRTEFVRTSYRDPSFMKQRTYSLGGTECFSCMSLSYEENWQLLKTIYNRPKAFTNRCNDKKLKEHIPLVPCGSICVTLLEPDVEAGVLIDYKYIRGCADNLLVHGFNDSALRTHRFEESDHVCRSLPRAQLYNPGGAQNRAVYGEVMLCSCFGSRCNGISSGTMQNCLSPLFLVFVVHFVKEFLLRIDIR